MEYHEARTEIARLKEETKKMAQKVFEMEYKKLFETYPQLQEFSWQQYTPYFNDGDDCIFSVGDIHTVNGLYRYNDINGDRIWNMEKGGFEKAEPHALYSISEELNSFIHSFDDEDMISIFGDHVEITINRNGTQIKRCDHD